MKLTDRNGFYSIILAMVMIITASLAIIAANCSYGNLERKAFNELNGTNYTMTQWRVYHYEIEKLYPFTGQGQKKKELR